MDSVNFINSQISISFKKSFPITTTSIDPHAETKKDKIVAYISLKVLIVRQLAMPELAYVSFTSEKDWL
jgi:hypothetical protein